MGTKMDHLWEFGEVSSFLENTLRESHGRLVLGRSVVPTPNSPCARDGFV